MATGPRPSFHVDPPSEPLPTADELLARRAREFDRRRAAAESRTLIDVTVTLTGAFGVALVGDPHVDDPGTDIRLLQSHVALFQQHDRLLPIGIGDYHNNWIGRLARLYAEQSTSAAEALVLVEWLVRSTRWLALVGGNHDLWSGAGDPIQWMARQARVQYEAHGVRLGLHLPNNRQIRINARHHFAGHSQYSPAFGVAKAAMMHHHGDHVLVAGHTHQSGLAVIRDHATRLITHALRIGSYKTYDRYAEEKGLPFQSFTCCPVVVVRPQFADDDVRLLTTFFEPETAADFLAWLQSRKSERGA